MRTKQVTCDICKKDITYESRITLLRFDIFNLPKVDLCRKCSHIIYRLIRKKQKEAKE